MTDPTAALAEALAVMSGAHPEATNVQRRDVGDYRLGLPAPHGMPTVAEYAAAILAAIDGWTLVPDEDAVYGRQLMEEHAAAQAELARLRPIEEATRAWAKRHPTHLDPEWDGCAEAHALRAALEAER